ncbi:kinase-like domain-containing protein [Scleroderma citrinum]
MNGGVYACYAGTIQTESKVVTQSLPCKVSSVRVNHLDDNASPDHTGSRRLEGYAIISSGTLQLNEELMTRWTASSGFLKYGNTIKVAIKTSRGTLLEVVDVEAIMKFLKELHSWSKLNHENVLPLIGIATQFDYTLSIVSPWMKKGDARNFVRDKSVDPRPLIEGIASGLCYLHNCIPTPLYHEDVKGANVLISEDGRALLTDFGLSFLTDSTFSMSTPGRVGGSLPWIPPEMLDGGEASTAGDVWAFAMTALELFTRQDPFHPCRSIFAILTRITQGPPDRPRLEDTHGRLTKEWWSMCSECWHPDPFSRPTMLQVTTKIEQIMACNRTRDDGITMTSSLALEEFSDGPSVFFTESKRNDGSGESNP